MDIINVTTNTLKLLNDTFCHVQMTKEGYIQAGAEYRVTHPVYGEVGKAMCILIYNNELRDIKPAVLLMDGNTGFVQQKKAEGYMPVEIAHVAFFQFTTRLNGKFDFLIRKELPRINIELATQTTLAI